MNIIYYYSKILKKIRGSALKNCVIHESSKVESGCNLLNVNMDKHSFCGYNCEITNCEIGSFTSIANGVVIGGGRHPTEWVSMSPVFYEGRDSVKTKFSEHKRKPVKRTIIGHDVWIGQNALIKDGVKIGNGAVVGMGSIVTKDIESYSIVAGNPARIIKYRFEKNVVEILLRSEWWLMDETELKENAMCFNDVKKFIEKVRKDEK